MNFPHSQVLTKEKVNSFFEKSISYHHNSFIDFIKTFEPESLYFQWRNLIRSIDELINIPIELNQKYKNQFLCLKIVLCKQKDMNEFENIIIMLKNEFDQKVSDRFKTIYLMTYAIKFAYSQSTESRYLQHNFPLNTVADMISFYQSRRSYFVTILSLIPILAVGSKKIKDIDIINHFQPFIDVCLMNITTAYYNLIINKSIPDYKVNWDGQIAIGNFDYSHLDSFYLEPDRLSIIDQSEFRPDTVIPTALIPKKNNEIFSFTETANAMSLYENIFQKYKVSELKVFRDINNFLCDIPIYIENNFDIKVPKNNFDMLQKKYKKLAIFNSEIDYFSALNSKAPFQKMGNYYYSTIVLLNRFITTTLSTSLMKNKTFQINSGFIFEDKVEEILQKHRFHITSIKRINRKEFDLITTKNRTIYNFQCKNNYYDIATISPNYIKAVRRNKSLCKAYEKALDKEVKREHLIQTELKIDNIHHFVISRFPVITRNDKIINFNELDSTIELLLSKYS